MRIAHFSDLHLTDDARRPWRLGDQASTLSALVDDVLACSPDLVLVGGDLYGHAVPHASTPAERAVLFPQLVRLAAVAPVVVVQGNHDLASEVEALAHLGGAWPIHVVTGAKVISIATPAGTAHVYALAYPSKRGVLAAELSEGGAPGAQRVVEEALVSLLGAWGHRVRRRRASHPDDVHVGLMHVQVGGCTTSGGEVLDGQEVQLTRHTLDGVGLDYCALGHLHKRQEVASRAWYCGSPWRNDHSERDPKGWHLVMIDPRNDACAPWDVEPDRPLAECASYRIEDDGRAAALVSRVATACRTFTTLDYAWSDAGWSTRPTREHLDEAVGAEVRMHLTVSEQHVAGCPWAAEVEAVSAVAWRVVEERTIVPVHRVRAPEVAAAESDVDKLTSYWSTLADPPTDADRDAALAAMAMLDGLDDAQIAAELRA